MLLLRNRHTYGYWITATAACVFGDGRFQKPDISASAYLVSSLRQANFAGAASKDGGMSMDIKSLTYVQIGVPDGSGVLDARALRVSLSN